MAALAEFVATEQLALTGLPLPLTILLSQPLSDLELMAFSRRNRSLRIESNSKGELEIMSPLGGEGGSLELEVATTLGQWTRIKGGTAFGPSTGFRLPDGSIRSPDASWISEDAWMVLSAEQRRRFPPLCPPFLIEILSESDSRATLEQKMEMWIANGAQLAWMIDPFAATLSIYRPAAAVEILSRPDWVEADAVVPGFRLETSRLWAK